MTKYQIATILLVSLIILSSIAADFFLVDYTTTIMVVMVWVSVLLLQSAFPKPFKNKYTFYIMNFFLLYILLNVGSALYGTYIDYKVAQFDLNHDLIFSPEEQTPEQQKYVAIWSSDVGRNFMPFTGALTSLISTILLFFIVKLKERFLLKKGGSAVR